MPVKQTLHPRTQAQAEGRTAAATSWGAAPILKPRPPGFCIPEESGEKKGLRSSQVLGLSGPAFLKRLYPRREVVRDELCSFTLRC